MSAKEDSYDGLYAITVSVSNNRQSCAIQKTLCLCNDLENAVLIKSALQQAYPERLNVSRAKQDLVKYVDVDLKVVFGDEALKFIKEIER